MRGPIYITKGVWGDVLQGDFSVVGDARLSGRLSDKSGLG